jgi:sporulation protein YlmC with PRC-barrel domain
MPRAMGHTSAIRAVKAIGTDVYDLAGKKIGEVKDIVLEKTSNSILFAVVSFENPLDQLRLLDARDHFQPPTAAHALLDLDAEHAL